MERSSNRASRGRVLLFGATGTIGRATARTLVERGYDVVCAVRNNKARAIPELSGADLRVGNVTDTAAVRDRIVQHEKFDAVVSCLASRTGAPKDAWAIDHQAHCNILNTVQGAGAGQFVLLSALCVQKPRLAFQHAKLAFEKELKASGMPHVIVRPTAFFKSISGQINRVKNGKPFLIFGDGNQTSCKPISDRDLAAYLVDCIGDAARTGMTLPIGGPGAALTLKDQGTLLFGLLGRDPRFQSVPPAMLKVIARVLGTLGLVLPMLKEKAELARIGHYYATESMLVIDPQTGLYSEELTPSTGVATLADHYRDCLEGQHTVDLGQHAVFDRSSEHAA